MRLANRALAPSAESSCYLGYGTNIRAEHFAAIESQNVSVDWFELITENYLGYPGRVEYLQSLIGERYPICFHGLTMSVGGLEPLRKDYLRQLRQLADTLQPTWISDHLCVANMQSLLPMCYTENSLERCVDRVHEIQDTLGRAFLFENTSSYLQFANSNIPEWEFIAALADKAGCGILLDLNNLYVNCVNHGWDIDKYLHAIPSEYVCEIHLGGFERRDGYLLDNHSTSPSAEVWSLYQKASLLFGKKSVLFEWDTNVPSMEQVAIEIETAKKIDGASVQPKSNIFSCREHKDTKNAVANSPPIIDLEHDAYIELIRGIQDEAAALTMVVPYAQAETARESIAVYRETYLQTLYSVIETDFPLCRCYLGQEQLRHGISAIALKSPRHNIELEQFCSQVLRELIECQEGEKREQLKALYTLEEAENCVANRFDSSRDLTSIAADSLIYQALEINPCAELIEVTFDVFSIEEHLTKAPGRIDPSQFESRPMRILVLKNNDGIWRNSLSEIEAQTLTALQSLTPIQPNLSERLLARFGIQRDIGRAKLKRVLANLRAFDALTLRDESKALESKAQSS